MVLRITRNNFLDNFFLDLVVWGHEHECRIDSEWNDKQAFFVTQPGSSVATSFCAMGKRFLNMLAYCRSDKKFQLKFLFKLYDSFYIKDVDLDETSLNLNEPDSCDKVITYCNELVDQLLERAEEEHTGHPKQPKQPLIRLRVFCPPDFETFSVQRFGQAYVSKVANIKDILHFSRKKSEKVKPTEIDAEKLKTILKQEGFDKQRVEDLVKKYFEATDDNKRLLVLSEVGVSRAVQEYVDKDVKEAISALVDHQIKKIQNRLKQTPIDHAAIDEELENVRDERKKNSQDEVAEFQSIVQNKSGTSHRRNSSDSADDMFENESFMGTIPKTRGRGRGRGSRGGRGGRGSSKANESTTSTSSRSSTRAVAKKSLSNTSTASKRKERQTDLNSFFNNTAAVNDVIELSDEEEIPSSKRRKVANQTRSRRGVLFDDLSD
ncbi:hypothetical protein CDAR_553441 [Caerostris darwini]|uniref:Mre11 DNA-binding domain-containing protein n=1 Tax=Caerostris darwini TaxID=1538125 RepID=A0AAV4T741_9ARAC|nr:hypothetical protein CDAR_553441 [Caerostris darwini]